VSTYAQAYQLGPFFDGGTLQASAKIYHYAAGTSTLKNIYEDRAMGTTLAQPFVSDANGVFNFFGDGLYKFIICGPDSTGPASDVLYTLDNFQILDPEADIVWNEGAAIPSASSVTVGPQIWAHVTGAVTITALSGTIPFTWLVFDGNLTLTHSAGLLCPDGANLAIYAGSVVLFLRENDAGTIWRVGSIWKPGKQADVASATTLTAPADGSFVDLTGTTTITGVTAVRAGYSFLARVTNAYGMTLSPGANFLLPHAHDYATRQDEVLLFMQVSATAWAVCPIMTPWHVPTLAKSTTYTTVAIDHGKLIVCTGTPWTLTLVSAATAKDGFVHCIKNAGSGLLTVASSDLIDGYATLRVHAGASVWLVCNGSTWHTVSARGDVPTGSPGRTLLKFGFLNMPQNVTRYGVAIGTAPNATESYGAVQVPIRCTIRNLRVVCSTAPPAGQTFTLTVRTGAVDSAGTFTFSSSAVTCTVTSAGVSASDLSNTVTVAAEEYLTIECVASATTGSTIDINATVELFDEFGDPLKDGVICVGVRATAAAGFLGEFTSSTSALNVNAPLPAGFVRTYTTGAGTGGIGAHLAPVTLPSDSLISSDEYLTFSWAGDGVSDFAQRSASQHSATTRNTYYPGLLIFGALDQAQNTTRYCSGWVNTATATETEVQIPMPACTVKNLRVSTSSAPAGGQSFTITVRKNTVDTTLTATVSSASRLASDTTHTVSFAEGDILSVKSVASATSGTRTVTVVMEVIQ